MKNDGMSESLSGHGESEALLQALNKAQRQAVVCCDAPSLVIAGAGSGKTRVLTYKIAYLLADGVPPWGILALTFTNKAAREMRERIGRLVGDECASQLWMGTFHSIFSRILRYECDAVGFTSHYTIYDDKDSLSLIKTIIREKGFDDKQYRPGVVAKRICEAKNELILPEAYAQDRGYILRDKVSRMTKMVEIYSAYQQRLRQSDAMDFDDLLLNTYLLLKRNPEICQKYEERFRYVLVDEYQDTNYAQHQIVWLLTRHRRRVSVVGDDAQSIYSFRGARIDNILTFQRSYPDARLFKLEQNYRSTQTIVGAANSVIRHNQRQIHKNVFSEKLKGEPIEVCEAYSDKEEAAIVARRIYELHCQSDYDFGQMAILYRTNDQSRAFEEEFMKRKYPYRIYGGLSFYQRKEVKDALAYLRLAVNPHDEEALRRIINYPARGIGKTTLDRVWQTAVDSGARPFDVLLRPSAYALPVNLGTQTKLSRFATFIQSYHTFAEGENADALAIRMLKESGLTAEINSGREPEGRERQANLQELVDSISSFVADNTEEGKPTFLSDFLQTVTLMTDQDKTLPEDGACITLMTIHAAKGLEFPIVFVVGMEDGLFPSEMARESGNIEEERRLFYVALTRAEDLVVLTWSHSRMRFGRFENNQRSPFLREIEPAFLRTAKPNASFLSASLSGRRDASPVRRPSFDSSSVATRPSTPSDAPLSAKPSVSMRPLRSYQSSFTASTPLPASAGDGTGSASYDAHLAPGTRIEHARFGMGTVVDVQGTGLDTKATVHFDNAGQKQLLLRFARFRVVEPSLD